MNIENMKTKEIKNYLKIREWQEQETKEERYFIDEFKKLLQESILELNDFDQIEKVFENKLVRIEIASNEFGEDGDEIVYVTFKEDK